MPRVVRIGVRSTLACLLPLLLLGACRARLGGVLPEATLPAGTVTVPAEAPAAAPTPAVPVPVLGDGAAPGDKRGPGGFVPRGAARNFYAASGGQLWYYLNAYYWAPSTAPSDDLWILTEVVEAFQDLKRWPDGRAVAGPEPKITVEYWEVGRTGRSVRLDNHKDFCLLADAYTAGAIHVRVTLTLGRLRVRDARGRWRRSPQAYVLESKNYAGGGGIGADATRFVPLASEAVTVWGYRVPWDTHPQRLTRSSWQDLELPAWELLERRPPPLVVVPEPDPALTPSPAAVDRPAPAPVR